MTTVLDRAVVAFDLDGTLTKSDTLMPFLTSIVGPTGITSAAVRAMVGAPNRSAAKERIIGSVLAGRTAALVEDRAWDYARQVVGQRLRPDIVRRLRGHLDQGHEVWVVSASPAVYVEPIATMLEVTGCCATELEVDWLGRYTGRFVGKNVRGAEKVARLAEVLDGRPLEYAYGNSAGDHAMLAAARHGLLV